MYIEIKKTNNNVDNSKCSYDEYLEHRHVTYNLTRITIVNNAPQDSVIFQNESNKIILPFINKENQYYNDNKQTVKKNQYRVFKKRKNKQ